MTEPAEQSAAPQSSTPRVAVVIVNYCTPGLVVDCLESIQQVLAEAPNTRVWVVDNASPDNSADQIDLAIADNDWSWAKLIRAEKNGGFSYGNNVGINEALAQNESRVDAVWLLNSDTLVRPGALHQVAQALSEAPDTVGALATRLEWPDGEPQVSCFRFIRPTTALVSAAATGPVSALFRRGQVALPFEEEDRAEWVSFASVVLTRVALEKVGLLDQGYFMYYEDVDYCQRLRQSGLSIRFLREARVVHLRGGSSPVKELAKQGKRRPRYYFASRNRYFAKWYGGVLGLFICNLAWYAGRGVSLLREFLGKRPKVACECEWRDIWTNVLSPEKGAAK